MTTPATPIFPRLLPLEVLHRDTWGHTLTPPFVWPQSGPEMKRTLNDRMIKALKPAAAGTRYEVRDIIVPGFRVRVTDKGQRTYMLRARYPGMAHSNRREIGDCGAITLEAARSKARRWLELIKQGIDPQLEEERPPG
jgi:Arm DNA-binding domain